MQNKTGSPLRSGAAPVPRYPALLTHELVGRGSGEGVFPFSAIRRTPYFLGRNGLWHATALLGLHPGDRVLMPAYNCGIEVEILLRRGLEVDFYPIGSDLAPPPGAIHAACGPEIRALYVIHYFGFPQQMQEAELLAKRLGIPLIEDCALALFTHDRGRPTGTTGTVSFFSLTKFLPLPDGGLLVVNQSDLPRPPVGALPSLYGTFTRTITLMVQGLELRRPGVGNALRRILHVGGRRLTRPLGLRGNDTGTLEAHTLGWRMSATSQLILSRLDLGAIARRRRRNYQQLLARLTSCEGLAPLQPTLPAGVVPLSLPIRVEDSERVASALRALGIGAAATWRAAHPAIPKDSFPAVEQLRQEVVELPIHQDLEERHLDLVAERVHEVIEVQRSRLNIEAPRTGTWAGVSA